MAIGARLGKFLYDDRSIRYTDMRVRLLCRIEQRGETNGEGYAYCTKTNEKAFG
jgi:hypothetical protein